MFLAIPDEMNSIDPDDYWTLKTIKRIMGKSPWVSLSSRELGEKLSVSQQSASRIILKLIDKGFIQRKIQDRRQNISITDAGLDVLFSEMNDLASVLEIDRTLEIHGNVISGLGEGRYYISRKSYIIQFQEKLGFIPYLGTLNIRIDPEKEEESFEIYMENYECGMDRQKAMEKFNKLVEEVKAGKIDVTF